MRREQKALRGLSHDPKTGERIGYAEEGGWSGSGASSSSSVRQQEDVALGPSLDDLVREERLSSRNARVSSLTSSGSGGSSLDQRLAKRISKTGAFKEDLDYMDEHAEELALREEKTGGTFSISDARKRQIDDYRRFQKSTQSCPYCPLEQGERGGGGGQGSPRGVSVISRGYSVYLAIGHREPLLPGHCFIIPTTHMTSLLECEEDVWEEVRNFQKCLIQLGTSKGQGYIFLETCLGGGAHRHAVMECIPLPSTSMLPELPGYFKEALAQVDEEWSQHRKVILTGVGGDRGSEGDGRPFRSALTPQLPYFHVWFGLDGRASGMGHIIEDKEQFPTYFGLEVIGEVVNGWNEDHPKEVRTHEGKGEDVSIEPRRWRRPRTLPRHEWRSLATEFSSQWSPFDWTKALE